MSTAQLMLPEYVMAGGSVLALVALMAWPGRPRLAYWIGFLTMAGAAVASWHVWGVLAGVPVPLFHYAVTVDDYSVAVNALVLLAGASTLLLAWDSERYGPEFPTLLVIAVLGMMTLGLAGDMVTLFIGVEMLSFPLYILVSAPGQALNGEAGLKYLLLGAFSSGILLFGLALLYGASGSLVLTDLARVAPDSGLAVAGLALVLAGLGFKLGVVPFHMWAPDVYQGSPVPVTNLMAFGTKVGAAAILLRVLAVGFYTGSGWWAPLIGYLAVLTMVVGNLVALPQSDMKRLLAYSGIGQVGFLLVGLASHNVFGARALLFYLLPYGLAVLGAFAVLGIVAGPRETVTVADLRGLAYRAPWLAALFLIAMLSFIGIPLTGGFVGKFYLIQAALFANQPGLAVGLVVATLLGVGAYLRPLQAMFARTGEAMPTGPLKWTTGGGLVLAVATVGTVGLGVYPDPVVHLVNQSAHFFWLH